jgi:glycerophosphoryl diester phosphodiesterase
MIRTGLAVFCCTVSIFLLSLAGCGDDGGGGGRPPANEVVRTRIDSLAPAANLGHRGTGVNRAGHTLPENSIPSFLDALAQGADGVELDVELTADGALLVMHDDTLDRTTTCLGCVSGWTLAEAQECLLRDGDGNPTSEHPPTLQEVYDSLPPDTMVNVELKVFEPPCLTDSTGPEALARATVATVRDLGATERTLFSSFDLTAAATVKEEDPGLYSALLAAVPEEAAIQQALELGLDAIHPLVFVPREVVQAILDAGLQVNIWTVNTPQLMNQSLDKGVTAIITDEPAVLREVIDARDD